ncbi:aldolase/citrate lyase family protein [Lysinibacter sp. HNR]|uniref:HpcH/HpaI aldolase family protein n=1 Tax=Lysinibacter sp. HNR TaxID=3031408 RepID=UPI0024354918|nr:aldolase/citrate lyase family protein [Lysinibacter sp. HNR]WGD37449.1 aldolase/citrate lyase family protein [Lysinibacter sp. HNR]
MPIRLDLPATLRDHLASSDRALLGLWVCSANPVVAEIVAGSGCDWILIDVEHSPNSLESVLAQLYAMSAYPVTPLVRLPSDDTVLIKQYLDLGVQNLLIPMVDSAEEAENIVRAIRYSQDGVRGVGAALARSSRWNRVEGYLNGAHDTISLTVQIESVDAVADVERILNVDGVDAVFIGPSDLAASMGFLGQQNHPEVVSRVLEVIHIAKRAGKPVGVNAFIRADAQRYLEAGADFVAVGADVSILARETENLIESFAPSDNAERQP